MHFFENIFCVHVYVHRENFWNNRVLIRMSRVRLTYLTHIENVLKN